MSITSVTLRNQKFLTIQFWSLSDLVSKKTALDLRDRSKNIFTFVQNRSKNDICYLYFENFFSKKIVFLELSNS